VISQVVIVLNDTLRNIELGLIYNTGLEQFSTQSGTKGFLYVSLGFLEGTVPLIYQIQIWGTKEKEFNRM
jgi:hypothetical protein